MCLPSCDQKTLDGGGSVGLGEVPINNSAPPNTAKQAKSFFKKTLICCLGSFAT